MKSKKAVRAARRPDKLGQLKEARHGTRHFTTWRPADAKRRAGARPC